MNRTPLRPTRTAAARRAPTGPTARGRPRARRRIRYERCGTLLVPVPRLFARGRVVFLRHRSLRPRPSVAAMPGSADDEGEGRAEDEREGQAGVEDLEGVERCDLVVEYGDRVL